MYRKGNIRYFVHRFVNMPGLPNTIGQSLNVLQRPLVQHSLNPVTGYFRDGFCRTNETDFGRHALAGVLSDEFLSFSASRGNDLRTIGLTGGCRWCLCVQRWKEAYDAFDAGQISRTAVPRVVLEATEASALDIVSIQQLQEFREG